MKSKLARLISTDCPRALASGLASPTWRSADPAADNRASSSVVLPEPFGPTRPMARTPPDLRFGIAHPPPCLWRRTRRDTAAQEPHAGLGSVMLRLKPSGCKQTPTSAGKH